MEILKEIGIFDCCFENEIVQPGNYLVVCRERKLMNLCLYITTESLEDQEYFPPQAKVIPKSSRVQHSH